MDTLKLLNGYIEVVKLLLEKGANIYALNFNDVHSDVKYIIEEKIEIKTIKIIVYIR